jgi:ABC-type multidrug transport system, ATPase and permease components
MQSSPPQDAAQELAPPAPAPSPAPAAGLRARLARLAPYFGNQRLAWIVAFAATIAGAATEPLIPALLKPLLDHGFTERDLPLWTVPVAIVGIFFIRGLAQFAGQYALARIANDGMQKLRQRLFERILVADMALFSRKTASALSNAVVYEVQTGAMLLVQALLGISRDGFTLVALLGYLIYLNWQLTLIVAVMVPGVGWIMKTLSGRVYRLTKSSQEATDELAYVVEENVLAHRMVRLHGAQASQARRFARLSQRLRQLAIKSTIASAATTPLTQLLAAVALSAVICIALWQSQGAMANREVTVGGFVAFIAAMLMLIAPIRRMADITSPITRGVAALERGLALLDEAGAESGGSYAVSARAGRDHAAGRERALRPRARTGARSREPERAAGRSGGAGRPLGRGQNHAREPAAALHRSELGAGAARRPRAARVAPGRAARTVCDGEPGRGDVQRQHRRERRARSLSDFGRRKRECAPARPVFAGFAAP